MDDDETLDRLHLQDVDHDFVRVPDAVFVLRQLFTL